MIWSVFQVGARTHILGIVNEPSFSAALGEARKLYGLVYDPVLRRKVERTLVVEPGQTQRVYTGPREEQE